MITFRRIHHDEGPAFRAIRLEALGESPASFGSTLTETAARPPEYWEGRAASGAAGIENVLFVAEDVGRWVGVAGGFLEDSTDERYVELVSMWVNPAYRGKNVGRRLIEQVVFWAGELDARRVELWVTETNSAAISLYRRCGFRETHDTQPLPSQPDLSESRMVLDLR